MIQINFKKLNKLAITPCRAKESDAGYDLFSIDRTIIKPGERRIIKTGLAIEIPDGYYGRIAPRSGLAIKNGIDVMAGVVDSGYRNEIGVVLINLSQNISRRDPISYYFDSSDSFVIKPGDRIAQIIIERCHSVQWFEKELLSDSERGMSGFGSTGV